MSHLSHDGRPLLLAILSALGGLGAAAAQDPAATPPTQVVVDRYTPAISRAAFAACDVDSDDRLSMFEAGRALAEVETAHDVAGFRRLDTDASGFIDWPEFDARFQQLVDRGHPLRFVPQRSFELAEERADDTPVGADPKLQTLIGVLDENKDGKLQVDEFDAAMSKLPLPKLRLDVDGSGTLEPTELAPLLRYLPPSMKTSPPVQDRLPDGYRMADGNSDGVLDRAELTEALRRLDADLVRWTDRVLRDADRSNNGSLGLPEILRARNDASNPSISAPKRRGSE